MVKITEDLIRRRAEHNECCLSTLEEVSLHQQDIERIEFIDQWCRELKILYLQSNLIPKIENVSKLKKLNYLNLALNNIEKIENLEGCEDLEKLDLTINFIGDLTSVESLRKNAALKELYLTGNPCADYECYRPYVVGCLQQLNSLDGVTIEKSERIIALQEFGQNKCAVIEQERIYRKKRERQKAGYDKPRNTNWYTNTETTENCITSNTENSLIIEELDDDEFEKKDKEFWNESVPFTPESRIKVHEHMKSIKKREENKSKKNENNKQERRYFSEDGRILNINEPKIEFKLIDNEKENRYELDVSIYKHMDSSLCDVDVQPYYVKILIKGKLLQLVLTDEISPDKSSAQRSKTTGHLLIKMPKVKEILKTKNENCKTENNKNVKCKSITDRTYLEFQDRKEIDYKNIVGNMKSVTKPVKCNMDVERYNSKDFIDNPDVPPLE